MVATEQLDALRMMSVDPVHLVVTPRALAMVSVMPLLSALFIVCGLFGGYAVGVALMGVDPGSYMGSLRSAVDFRDDVAGSFLKAVIFGILVGLIATYRGYSAVPTSAGVGAATTATVVVASIPLADTYRARVRLDLDERLKLPIDTSASVMTSGLLGDRYVSLQLGGETELLKSGDQITITESAVVLERLIGKLVYSGDRG